MGGVRPKMIKEKKKGGGEREKEKRQRYVVKCQDMFS